MHLYRLGQWSNLGSTRSQYLYYGQWEGVHRMLVSAIGGPRLGIAGLRE